MKRVMVLLATGAIGAACGVGDIGEASTDPSDNNPVTLPDGGTAPPFVPATASIKRLTQSQYGRTIHELFGLGIKIPGDLEVDTKIHGFTTVGSSELTISPRAAEQFEVAAYDVSKQVFSEPARRTAFVGCDPKDAADPCIKTFLASFGRRAWRRPLSEPEILRWSGVVTDVTGKLGSVWTGLEHAVSGLLQSPYFLFRVEVGPPIRRRPGDFATTITRWRRASRSSSGVRARTTRSSMRLDAPSSSPPTVFEIGRAHV